MNRSFPFCSTEAAAAAAGASIPVAIDSLASAGPPLLLSISFSTAQRHQQGSLCLETLAPRFSYRGSQPEILRDQGAAGGASAESERGGWPLEEKMTCRRKQMLQIPDAALRPRVSLSPSLAGSAASFTLAISLVVCQKMRSSEGCARVCMAEERHKDERQDAGAGDADHQFSFLK